MTCDREPFCDEARERVAELERVNADLLAALRDMVDIIGGDFRLRDMFRDNVYAAKESIAKAEGK